MARPTLPIIGTKLYQYMEGQHRENQNRLGCILHWTAELATLPGSIANMAPFSPRTPGYHDLSSPSPILQPRTKCTNKTLRFFSPIPQILILTKPAQTLPLGVFARTSPPLTFRSLA